MSVILSRDVGYLFWQKVANIIFGNFISKPQLNSYWFIIFQNYFSLVKILHIVISYENVTVNHPFCVLLQRCEPYHRFTKRHYFVKHQKPNICFFLRHYFGDIHRLMYKKLSLLCLDICHQLLVFKNNSSRICPIKLKISFIK